MERAIQRIAWIKYLAQVLGRVHASAEYFRGIRKWAALPTPTRSNVQKSWLSATCSPAHRRTPRATTGKLRCLVYTGTSKGNTRGQSDFLRIHSDWLRDGRDPWGNYGKIVPPIYEGHEQTRGGDTSTRAPSASSDAASGATSPRKQPLNTEVAA